MIGPATTTGELSASSQAWARPGYLHGVEFNPPVSGQATLKLYDGTSSAGKLLTTLTSASGETSISVQFVVPRVVNFGIYASLSGISTYVVAFSP